MKVRRQVTPAHAAATLPIPADFGGNGVSVFLPGMQYCHEFVTSLKKAPNNPASADATKNVLMWLPGYWTGVSVNSPIFSANRARLNQVSSVQFVQQFVAACETKSSDHLVQAATRTINAFIVGTPIKGGQLARELRAAAAASGPQAATGAPATEPGGGKMSTTASGDYVYDHPSLTSGTGRTLQLSCDGVAPAVSAADAAASMGRKTFVRYRGSIKSETLCQDAQSAHDAQVSADWNKSRADVAREAAQAAKKAANDRQSPEEKTTRKSNEALKCAAQSAIGAIFGGGQVADALSCK
jgi:hypothetical protein